MTLGNLWLVRRCWKCISDSAGSWSNAPRVEVTRCDVSPPPSWVWREGAQLGLAARWAEPGPGGEAALTAEWRGKGLWRLGAHPPLQLVLRLFYFWLWVFSLSLSLSLSLTVLMRLFQSFAVGLWVSFILALLSFAVVKVCCRPEGLSPQFFQWPTHRGPHLGAADWICGLKHSEAWSIHCEQQHSGPRRFNRRPQRFLFRPTVLSFTALSHVDVRGCVVLLFVFCVFEFKWGRVGIRSQFSQSEHRRFFTARILLILLDGGFWL